VAGALAVYAFYVEPRWLELTRRRISIPKLSKNLEGLRIALITDLHAGGGTTMELIRRACRLAMQERPDLIALTGDLSSDGSSVSELAVVDVLSVLTAPLGVYAVPGNHDHARGIEEWKQAVAAYDNIINLTNRVHTINHHGAEVGVAGLDDFDTGETKLDVLKQLSGTDLNVLLAHNPDTAELLQDVEPVIDLVLSGHTHGGQVRLPGLGAMRNPSHFEQLYEAGMVKRPWTTVYVSRGVGTVHAPVRLFCRPEVAILELTSVG
jgi:uncharacterized protein